MSAVVYVCRDCGHRYGFRPPGAPVIALHLAVSHGGLTPVVEVAPTSEREVSK